MKEYEFTAKTLEQAIEKGLQELNVNQEDVDIVVISEGGIFQKAKILISVEEDEEEKLSTSTITGDDLVISKPKGNTKKQESEPKENTKKTEPETKEKSKKQESKDNKKQKTVKIENDVNTEEKNEIKEESFKELFEQTCKSADETISETLTEIDINTIASYEFLKGLFNEMNLEATFVAYKTERGKKISIQGDNVATIIGHRGDGLNAIQTLVNAYETKLDRNAERVFIDIASYSERKIEHLKSLAHRVAKNVIKTQRRQRLDPMNSYERRIVHVELQNNPKIRTYSKGEEPNRYLVVEYIR